MNGVAIGLAIIVRHRRRIQRGQPQALAAWAVVVVGAAMWTSARCRVAVASLSTTDTTPSGSVW